MKTIYRLILLGVALGAFRDALWAVEPTPPRTAGKVLVLDNGRTLEGDIERHGDQFRIQRDGGEIWVPANGTMRLCADWQDAFAFMTSRANLFDPDERLRLARWCQLHGLKEQALAEVSAVVKMRPSNLEARQMQALLQRSVTMGKTAPVPENVRAQAPAGPTPLVDISSDSVALFTTRVQPILMNTCVSCHSNGRGGQFNLVRSYDGGQRVATQKNLAAVLALIDTDRPVLSPLLIKAISAHGNTGQPPLKSRQSIPFQSLQEWVEHLLVNNPQLRTERSASEARFPVPEARRAPVVAYQAPAGKPEARTVPQIASETKPMPEATTETRPLPRFTTPPAPATARNIMGPEPASQVAAEKTGPATSKSAAPAAASSTESASSFSEQAPAASAEPADPFDPIIFNRQMHPKQ